MRSGTKSQRFKVDLEVYVFYLGSDQIRGKVSFLGLGISRQPCLLFEGGDDD